MKPEFRLYYDDDGNVVSYSGEKTDLPYNSMIIDAATYAACRFDIKIKNGKIISATQVVWSKYVLDDNDGIKCAIEDVSVIVSENEPYQKWRLVVNEIN
jgi:hypothetical protein